MPLTIIVGLVSLLVALVLYSMGTWAAFRANGFSARTLGMLWTAAAFDVLATAMMALQFGGLDLRPGTPFLHTVVSLAAMTGMIGCTAVATWAFSAKRDGLARTLSRVIVASWVLWVGVFVWGMMTRGAARMGG